MNNSPILYDENNTMQNLYSVQSDELNKGEVLLMKIISNLFVKSADIDGIERMEKFYNIKGNALFSLEERRSILMNKILYKPPFTRQRLNEILSNIWGDGNFVFELNPETQVLIIDINTQNPTIYLKFTNEIRRIIPANIHLIMSIQYTYLYMTRWMKYSESSLGSLTYGELSQYSEYVQSE